MGNNIVYDLVDPQELIDFVRLYDNEVLRFRFALDQILPNRPLNDIEFRIRQGTLQDVDTAEFRAWDTPASMTGRPGITRIRGELPPLSRQIPLGEEEMLRLRQLEGGTNDPIITAIYDDASRMVRAVQARMELARGQVLSTGKCTIDENGLTIEADYGMSGSNFATASNLWTDATLGKPLSDLLTWCTFMVDTYGVMPAGIIMPKARFNNLFLNAEMRAAAASNGTTPARLTAADVRAILLGNDLPPVIINDEQVRVNGAATRVLPANKVILVPPSDEPLGNTFYGVTAEAIKLRSKGVIVQEAMPGIVALVTESEHPVQTFTVGTAIGLPVLANPNLLFVGTVSA